MKSTSPASRFPARPILVATISLAICSLVGGYQLFVSTLPQPAVTEVGTTVADGDYALGITLSFDARGDAFDPTALLVRLDGKTLLEKTETVPAGTPLKIHPVEGLIRGLNELFIQVGTGGEVADPAASQPDPFAEAGFGEPVEPSADDQETPSTDHTSPGVAKAIRVRVFDGDQLLVERTVWSEPGEPVSSTILLDLTSNEKVTPEDAGDHDGHHH